MSTLLSRRHLLRGLGFGLAACPLCLSAAALASEKGAGHATGAPHWGYDGEGGPDNWGTLSADFKVCELGTEQTPIDLAGAVRAEVGGLEPRFGEMPLTILNNGHTIQVNCAPGSGTLIKGERYELVQFHFHHPSEHLLSGKSFALELHFVHKNAAGNLAVLGVFFEPGKENPALAPIFGALPREAGPAETLGAPIRPAELLPPERGYFRYHGSLTTPPCSEGVLWTVFKAPLPISEAQIQQFASLFPNNARPVLPRHRRFLLESA